MLDTFRAHALSHPLLVLGVCYFAIRAGSGLTGRGPTALGQRRPSGVSPHSALLALFLAALAINVAVPAYVDHVEPSVAALSWAVMQGQPAYPAADAALMYGLPYGPALYLINGLVMKVAGPGIPVSKLAGVIAAAASLLMIAAAVRRAYGDGWHRALGWTSGVYLAFGVTAFWVRAEPLLLLCSSLAALSLTVNGRAAAILAGTALGLGMNLKISAALYLLPALILLAIRQGRGTAALTAGVAATVGALPFVLFENISAQGYLQWVQTTAGHGFRLRALPSSLEWALFVAVPLPLFARDQRSDVRWLSWLLAVTVIASVPLASKHGTGAYHFLPFVPLILFAACGSTEQRTARSSAVLIASLVLAGFQVPYWIRSATGLPAAEILAELRRIEQTTTGSLAMGYSPNYRLSFFRPQLVFDGHPHVLDGASAMDAAWSGRPFPGAVLEQLRSCGVDNWVVPTGGAPFELPNAYGGGSEVFPEEFRRAFHASYRLREPGRWFAVWSCAR